MMIAALFVDTRPGSVYAGLGIDPWGIDRDARTYAGPHAVIAHPPCARWGRYWFGGPSVKIRKELGADEGCFAAALKAVTEYGGVIEHPAYSRAWDHFGIGKPFIGGGWTSAGKEALTCHVEQGNYGHCARKATWLYVCKVQREKIPQCIWGPSTASARLDIGYHSKEDRKTGRLNGITRITSKRVNEATPEAFRDLLLSIALKVGK